MDDSTVRVVPPDPLVSVIIPNHNYGRFVPEAIESALAQTYPRIEVIVVDDASTDDSLERIQPFLDQVRLVALGTNVGFIRAVTTGFEASRGAVICPLDADDRWVPEKVQNVVDAFARKPELTQVSHWLRTIDADGSVLSTTAGKKLLPLVPARRRELSRGDLREQLFRWNRYEWGLTSGVSYPRWVLEEILPPPPEFSKVPFDTWTTVAAAFLGEVGAIDGDLMDYRVHGANMQGGQVDFSMLVDQRRLTGDLVDYWARRTGDPRRSNVDAADNLLVLLRFLAGEPVPARSRLRALGRSVLELRDLAVPPVDGSMHIVERAIKASSRHQGTLVHQLGPGRWLRHHLARVAPSKG